MANARQFMAARTAAWAKAGGKKPLTALQLSGVMENGFYCPINGDVNLSFGYWTNKLMTFTTSPSWKEYPSGWGGSYFGTNSSSLEIRFGSGSSNTKVMFPYTEQSGWHHYLAVRNNSNYYFYVDGLLVKTNSISNAKLKNNADYFRVTKGFNDTRSSISRSVCLVTVFERALSSQEVYALSQMREFNVTDSIFNSCCVAAEMLEGSGSTWTNKIDNSTVQLNGTLNWNVQFDV